MRTGIFGGTFDPPHLGHMLLAQEAMEKAELDRVIFIPCGNPPHKESGAVTDAAVRFEMVRRAIEGNPDFEISDMEIRSQEPSYTAKTLEKLKKIYPDDSFCFIVGADSLCEMEAWYCPGRIFDSAEIIGVHRGGSDFADMEAAAGQYRLKYNAKITLIKMKAIEMSSSDIRERIKNGKSTRYMLPCGVTEYIKKKGLYTE